MLPKTNRKTRNSGKGHTVTQDQQNRKCLELKEFPTTTMRRKEADDPRTGKKLLAGGATREAATSKNGRRSSARLQNQNFSSTPGKPCMESQMDSAYDGDEESSPGTTTQSEGDDPYSISSIEDVPVVPKARKKKRGKQNGTAKTITSKAKTTSRSNKRVSTTSSGHASSTPNLPTNQAPARRAAYGSPSLSATPEVTPILPYQPPTLAPCSVSSGDRSLSTPHIYQTRLRRSSRPVSSPSGSASPCLGTSSSQADSGIAVSPPAKRARIQPAEPRHKSAAVLGKKFMNKRNIFSPNSKANLKNDDNAAKENMNSSCFGFDYSNTSSPSAGGGRAKENMDSSCFGFNSPDKSHTEGTTSALSQRNKPLPATDVYRSAQPVVTSDSSPTSPPLASTDSDSYPHSSSQCLWPSPGLFSDDIFSADSESLTVNRSVSNTYKQVKVKKLKHKKPVPGIEQLQVPRSEKVPKVKPQKVQKITKFEAWAHERNMEIEDIERFDLNIE